MSLLLIASCFFLLFLTQLVQTAVEHGLSSLILNTHCDFELLLNPLGSANTTSNTNNSLPRLHESPSVSHLGSSTPPPDVGCAIPPAASSHRPSDASRDRSTSSSGAPSRSARTLWLLLQSRKQQDAMTSSHVCSFLSLAFDFFQLCISFHGSPLLGFHFIILWFSSWLELLGYCSASLVAFLLLCCACYFRTHFRHSFAWLTLIHWDLLPLYCRWCLHWSRCCPTSHWTFPDRRTKRLYEKSRTRHAAVFLLWEPIIVPHFFYAVVLQLCFGLNLLPCGYPGFLAGNIVPSLFG